MTNTNNNTIARVRNALAWRLHRLLGDRVVYGTLLTAARRWRRILRNPVFIGVAGSAGKTTAKELLLGMLSHHGNGVGNVGSFNNIEEIAKAILRERPTHRFFVTELSEDRPGAMDRPLELVQPSVGIVTVFGDDHLTAFDSREQMAAEMGKLVRSLPPTGTAVLNADDPVVLAMATTCRAKIITYGLSATAQLRADNISATWPDRLQMTLRHGSAQVQLRTQLCGSHWVPSVLGAIGGGLAVGMTLDECATGISGVAPSDGRMQPVHTPEGVTFIRDDFKAPLWTLDACLDFMRTARATRKIIVIDEISDIKSGKEQKYAKVALLAQEIADITVFVGNWGSSVLKSRKPGTGPDALRAFRHVRDAALYVNSVTREGDLVLLKGTTKQEHLLRIIMARTEDVSCWRDDCNRFSFCNECPDKDKPSGGPATVPIALFDSGSTRAPQPFLCTLEPEEQVIVGLGNPESRYNGTPHNAGHEAVNKLASSLDLRWNESPEAWIARGSALGKPICIVKTKTPMNHTGLALMQLAKDMAFGPQQCILVYDALDLPLGEVRNRLRGGAGGHLGVDSILEAFQTDEFRRVKVGVGQASAKLNAAGYVLTPFDAESQMKMNEATDVTRVRLLDMLARHPIAP